MKYGIKDESKSNSEAITIRILKKFFLISFRDFLNLDISVKLII